MATTISKRIILCCDGTWQDSDNGYQKPTLIPYNPTGTLQIATNVTRISRAINRVDATGKPQIIYYHAGVGSSVSSVVDKVTGGLLGSGIQENIREVYSFAAANYLPGDEIVLIGFSRGAFTARSVAGMIADIGLLTREGMETFYPIFKDQENARNLNYHDIFPDLPFPNKPKDISEYRLRLEKAGLTKVTDPDGTKIRVLAVAVWDTVGSLGIPDFEFLSKLGLPRSTAEYKFYDTKISPTILHAFQALALDESRAPFSPAVWERDDSVEATDLRQVWFPGSHSGVGGGYDDQEIADISLTWMMDQLASVGVSFHDDYIDRLFMQNTNYYENLGAPRKTVSSFFSRKPSKQWAIKSIYDTHKPVRPWGLGKIFNSLTGLFFITGKKIRTPGLYMRVDPNTGSSTNVAMTNTNERIHCCVRVRLELEGLGPDDIGLYKCPALLQIGPWRLKQVRLDVEDPISHYASWGPGTPAAEARREDDLRWVWEYDGPKQNSPKVTTMIEENLGPYQRKLLLLTKGMEVFDHVVGPLVQS